MSNTRTNKFEVGFKFIARSDRKIKRVKTVVDFVQCVSLTGVVVDSYYVCEHLDAFDRPVKSQEKETTLAMGEPVQ